MLRLQSISKSFGSRPVLRDFSLDVDAGENFILLGQSGCGKTTLLRIIAGFEQPDSGNVWIDGEPVTAWPVEKRPVGFIFQRHALFPHMTVYDNIAVGPRIRGLAEADIERQIDELLEVTRLQELKHAWPGRLSGGESQRVALARALINRPKLLLLDEPLSALDPGLRWRLREELTEMQKAFGITFLFVTHDQEEAMSLATRMGVMESGRLLQVGAPDQLYDRPQDPFVAGFLGETNRLAGEVVSAQEGQITVRLDSGETVIGHQDAPVPVATRVQGFVRPEHLVVPDAQSHEPVNRIRATFKGKAFLGNLTKYRFETEAGETVYSTQANNVANPIEMEPGATVTLGFSPGQVRFFQTQETVHDV